MEGGKDGGRLNRGVTEVIMCHSEQEAQRPQSAKERTLRAVRENDV